MKTKRVLISTLPIGSKIYLTLPRGKLWTLEVFTHTESGRKVAEITCGNIIQIVSLATPAYVKEKP